MTRLRRTWDWVLGWALIGLAAVVLLVSGAATANARHVADQLCLIISGGLGGLLLLGAGSTVVISAGLADEGRKLDRLEAALPFSPPGVPPVATATVLRRARIVAASGMAVGLAFVGAAWFRASGNPDPNPAGFEALGAGAVGLFVAALAAVLATMSVKRNIQLRKSRLLFPWLGLRRVHGDPPRSEAEAGASGRILVASGLTRFHVPGCLAVHGLATHEVDAADVPPELAPCELCHTDLSEPRPAPDLVLS